MTNSTPQLAFKTTDRFKDHTAHGLLAAAYQKAVSMGLFATIASHVSLRMKKKDYSWLDKFTTLWASILAGCDHTSHINTKLGPHEQALAAVFGFARFPDQSVVNRLLWAFGPEHVEQYRRAHLALMARFSRIRDWSLWSMLADRTRVVFVDLDQRALTVSSTRFELAVKGFFGRKRGRYGYQLSVAFIGGRIQEVLDEYLDRGDTAALSRLDALLDSIAVFCDKTRTPRECIVLRGDAQYGTPEVIARIRLRHFHFLLKGLSSARADKLEREQAITATFETVSNGPNREPAQMADLGVIAHVPGGRGATPEPVEARTLLLRRVLARHPSKRPDPKTRAARKASGSETTPEPRLDYFLTSLDATKLPVSAVLDTYHGRSSIERFFYDEQYALAAKQVRTHHHAGEAMFEFLVATTSNFLRWMQKTTFRGTELARMGLTRLISEAMQIPARIRRSGQLWTIELPSRHPIVRKLLGTWKPLLPGHIRP